MIFGQHHPRDRHFAAADMGVRIDAACHDDPAVDGVFVIDLGVGRRRDYTAVLNKDVANFAIDAVRGIVDAAACKLDEHS